MVYWSIICSACEPCLSCFILLSPSGCVIFWFREITSSQWLAWMFLHLSRFFRQLLQHFSTQNLADLSSSSLHFLKYYSKKGLLSDRVYLVKLQFYFSFFSFKKKTIQGDKKYKLLVSKLWYRGTTKKYKLPVSKLWYKGTAKNISYRYLNFDTRVLQKI